jgi:hypothetical protein
MTHYASETTVPPDRSRAEIERTLERYGATGFMYGWDGDRAVIAFRMKDRMLRMVLPLPDRQAEEFKLTPTKRRRTESSRREAYELAVRQRWRALALVIKAKLEAVESGIATFEEEFLGYIVLPDGQTVGDWMVPQVQQAYLTATMPPLLPGPRP